MKGVGMKGISYSLAYLLVGITPIAYGSISAQTASHSSTSNRAEPAHVEEVYIFDGAVEDIQHLSRDIINPVYVLDTEESGLTQIVSIAEQHPNIQQWHVISHGQVGELQLGNERWNKTWLNQTNLSYLQFNLSAGHNIKPYAFDLAQGYKGKEFVAALATHLDIDLEASTDKTGSIAGAEIELEYHYSPEVNKSQLNFSGYPHTLTLSNPEAYANETNNNVPNPETYTNAGIANVREENVADYNKQIRALNQQIDFQQKFEIQGLVNAINQLDDYATIDTESAPTYLTYLRAGFMDLKHENVNSVNVAIKNSSILYVTCYAGMLV